MPDESVNQGKQPNSSNARKQRGLPLRGILARKDTWLGQNWKTIVAVLAIFAVALMIRQNEKRK